VLLLTLPIIFQLRLNRRHPSAPSVLEGDKSTCLSNQKSDIQQRIHTLENIINQVKEEELLSSFRSELESLLTRMEKEVKKTDSDA
jgi:hypothetical protein